MFTSAVNDPDRDDADAATNHDLFEFFADRADTFGAKARFMTACAESVRAIGVCLATSPLKTTVH